MSVIGELGNETRSKVEYETKYIEWRIPGIFTLIKDQVYKSPYFSTTDGYSSWQFGLMLKSDLDITIDIRNDEKLEYLIEYCFGLKKCDGTIKNSKCGTVEGDFICSAWGNLIEKTELLHRKSELAPSNILTVTCTLKWRPEIIYSPLATVSQKLESLQLTRLDKLSANFKDFYADKETCDVTLKVQDKEFQAHRIILMARSSVFSATFKHDTLEKQTGIITIPDCDSDSFQAFLDYLYSGELVDLSLSSAINLYYTSNKYDIEEVKQFCTEYLMQCLSIETICEVAEFADKYDEATLFSQIQDFFCKNSLKVLLTSGWENLTGKNYRLANKLLTHMAKAKIEE